MANLNAAIEEGVRAPRPHRSDIDGLRAVAVLAVILFHAHVPGFSGGFVGVDVFFVISGYLITGIIHREIQTGRFSIVEFYERRIRRIFPALFVVLAFTTVVAYKVILPGGLADLGRSLLATTLFLSNLYFLQRGGYFDGPSELKPLLHTWSLSVEEQFYIFFPVYLFMVIRYIPRRVVAVTSFFAAASFASSAVMTARYPTAAFYLAPVRAHELLLGSLVALDAFPQATRRWTRNGVSWLGIALIGWSIVTYSAESPFPGARALVPCAGAALLLHAGALAPSGAGRLLGFRPIVFVGLISYSLYLWHWPLLALARHWVVQDLDTAQRAGALLAALVLSILSWRFIERPFRGRNALLSKRALFAGASVAIIAGLAVGRWATASNGIPGRFGSVGPVLVTFSKDNETECVQPAAVALANRGACVVGSAEAKLPTFAVWGDSHAKVFFPAIDAAAKAAGVAGLYAAWLGCPPILDVRKVEAGRADHENAACTARNAEAFATIAGQPSIEAVILIARWPYYGSGHGYGVDKSHRIRLYDLEGGSALTEDQIEERATRTLRALLATGKAVYLVETVPEFTVSGDAYGRVLAFGVDPASFDEDEAAVDSRSAFVHRLAQRFAEDAHFHLLPTHDLFCANRICRFWRDGLPLYVDNNHIGPYANPMVTARVSAAVRRKNPGAGSSGAATDHSHGVGDAQQPESR